MYKRQSYELTSALQVGPRYQLEWSERTAGASSMTQRALLDLRAQLNFLAWIPWVSLAGGVRWRDAAATPTLGVGVGADLRSSGASIFHVSARYFNPRTWVIGVGWGWRIALNDPFDP